MPVSRYRLNSPITVVVCENDRQRLTELPAGSVLLAADSKPHLHRMISATCNGETIFVFARDLEERAESTEPVKRLAPAGVVPATPGL